MKFTIWTLIIMTVFACNTEEGIAPAQQNAFIKIIKGRGTDNPLKIEALSDGNLLIVSNSTINDPISGTITERVRLVRVDANGELPVSNSERYYPQNQSWRASQVLVLPNDNIVIGGTIGNQTVGNTALFFMTVSSSLDSINSQIYTSGADNYSLTGLNYDEASSRILFGGSEQMDDAEDSTFYGELSVDNLTIETFFKTHKAKALPATALYKDSNGRLNWVYNSGNSVLVRSNGINMQQIEDAEPLNFPGSNNIFTKQLLASPEGNIMLFGEHSVNSQIDVFMYQAFSASPIFIGGEGNDELRGVKKIEDGYLISGSSEISRAGANEQTDFFLSRRGPNGGEVFTKSFGSNENEVLHDAVMVNDRIFAIGSTVIGIENTLLLIKTNGFGELED
ncbi:hypothetical protein [Marivirga sp.]|uniref:hypothetical protein n=1 Tax=Marivirga sp. TaxID=2018662 RepID=UPI002D801A25|nr:hypothetical protein [Marivirga sp.]